MAGGMRSIGQVLEVVRPEFSDISISKIRYLESEGLLSPERDQPSGYRRYSSADIERLRYILRAQRDQYLPLRVIKDNLERLDQGLPEEGIAPEPVVAPVVVQEPPEPPAPAAVTEGGLPRNIRLSRRQLLEKSGLPEAALIELERHKIITMRRGSGFYGRDALTIAIAARRLAAFGIDTRHLRLIYTSAMQEAGLVDQAVAPYRQRTAHAAVTAEVLKLVLHAHAAMMQSSVNR